MKNNRKLTIILALLVVMAIFLNSCKSSEQTGDASSGSDVSAESTGSDTAENPDASEGDAASANADSGAEAQNPSQQQQQSQADTSKISSRVGPVVAEKELSVKILSEGKAEKVKSVTPRTSLDNDNVHPKSEAPPVVLKTNNNMYSFVNTAWSYAIKIKSGKSLLTDADAYDPGSSHIVTTADYVSQSTRKQILPGAMSKYTYWKRIYNGVFGAAVIKDKNGTPFVLGISHGENCNQINFGVKYENSIKPAGLTYDDATYMGYRNGKWVNAFDNYFAFVNASLAPVSDNDGVDFYKYDKGPVLWPSNGLIEKLGDDYVQRSMGLRHPSLFIDNGYIYLFYLDGSSGHELGRTYGIKAARAPLSSMGASGSFKTLYGGAYNEPAIPFIYNKNDTNYNKDENSYVYKKGGRSDVLFAGTYDPIRFSVAKIKNSNYYLGVLQHGDDGAGNVFFELAVSRDLITWSEPVEIKSATKKWDEAYMNYPMLYNADMTDYMSIDMNNFLIVGTKPNETEPFTMKMSIKIEEK